MNGRNYGRRSLLDWSVFANTRKQPTRYNVATRGVHLEDCGCLHCIGHTCAWTPPAMTSHTCEAAENRLQTAQITLFHI